MWLALALGFGLTQGTNSDEVVSDGSVTKKTVKAKKQLINPNQHSRYVVFIISVVLAAIVLLGGGGTGAYFLLTRGGESVNSTFVGTEDTSVTIPLSITTVTSTTLGTFSTTLPTAPSTIPSRPVFTSEPSDIELQQFQLYMARAEILVSELDKYDRRLPELAETINATAPSVPKDVWQELDDMAERLRALLEEGRTLEVPRDFIEVNHWLIEAGEFMMKRLTATLKGIEVMWESQSPEAAKAHFDEARQARDDFRNALQQFLEHVPLE